ncbi:putative Na+/H+ antiporter [bacterium]|nr:putative Na+/H+ antiporter [bacterium]
MNKRKLFAVLLLIIIGVWAPLLLIASGYGQSAELSFPHPLEFYNDSHLENVSDILLHRIKSDPLNLIVTICFFAAIIHTFCVGWFQRKAEEWEEEHAELQRKNRAKPVNYNGDVVESVSFRAEMFHYLGEVEVVFGLWVIPVFWAIAFKYGWNSAEVYISGVNFTEPMFVVVVMTLASTRPISRLSENSLALVAKLGKGSTAMWWFSVLTIGPILGSFITEPGAMTISAMLLAKQFYNKAPSAKFSYATIGLLFVNISVGGTLSHFAAPPVLMVASKWNWDLTFMVTNYGWKAVLGILIANTLYFLYFRSEFKSLEKVSTKDQQKEAIDWELREEEVPLKITIIHVALLVWTVLTSHYPALFISGFFVFIGFRKATAHHQNDTNLKPSMLVGFFLAGLVIHGGLQGWWIAPILGSLSEVPLMLGATFLTAFNDNAAITYLSTLVPNLSDSMKYAVVAGAVTGGGLTVIANAPNPAGISILRDFFPHGVSPLKLALGALIPTIIMGLCFMLLP